MLNKRIRDQIAGDPEFRLALSLTAKSDGALSLWIVHRVLRDDAFLPVVQKIANTAARLTVTEESWSSTGWSGLADEDREKLLTALPASPVFRHLVLEAIRDNGNRLKVISGLENTFNRVIGEDKEVSSPGEGDPGADTRTSIETPNGGTLLRWALASLVGVGTVAGGVVATRQVAKEYQQTREDFHKTTTEQTQEIDRLKERLPVTDAPSQGCPSVSVDATPCDDVVARILATVVAIQEKDQQQLANVVTSLGVVVADMRKSAYQEGQRLHDATVPPPPINVNVKLSDLPPFPAFPSQIKLAPPHDLQSLPATPVLFAGTGDFAGGKLVTVVYPAAYDATVSCTFSVALAEIENPAALSIQLKSCTDDAPVGVSSGPVTVPVELNHKPIYVPELHAFVAVAAERRGLFHLGGWQRATLSIQAEPFADRRVKTQKASNADGFAGGKSGEQAVAVKRDP